MSALDFTTSILVDQTENEVFNAINNVRGWWSEEIEGNTEKPGDVFNYHFEDIHRCKIKLIEVIPNKKIVWHVIENYFKPGIFNDPLHPSPSEDEFDKAEWVNTMMRFEIFKKDKKTKVRFTHLGLVPGYECYDVCTVGWGHYIRESLFGLITTGKGHPNSTDRPMTEHEEKFHAAADKA